MKSEKNMLTRKRPPKRSSRMVETIYGCKWSLTVYQLLARGVNRPGEMVRSVEGLTTKVLNECLRRNMEFGILERISYAEIPPRVEYNVTEFGQKFLRILDDLEKLQEEIDSSELPESK
ncbi:winged helix-turn-helix transcriptional regulator [Microbulbifer sp. EKSA008]|uniref:winged helix-turn-helix transcriptional regulator n=1 Tax=unclassified Microbulbifer TaxID=2619833 RepID=UPI0040390F82